MTEAEFIELYNKQAEALLRYCALRLASHHDAEDVTAEVFARLLAEPDRVSAEKRVRWLFSAARNLCTDFQRGISRRSEAHCAESDGSDASSWTDERVGRIVRSMPRDRQEVVFLRLFQDLPFAQVARIVGRRETAVRVQYYRALKRLRKLLKEVGT